MEAKSTDQLDIHINPFIQRYTNNVGEMIQNELHYTLDIGSMRHSKNENLSYET
jgi:hypothetical protein